MRTPVCGTLVCGDEFGESDNAGTVDVWRHSGIGRGRRLMEDEKAS